MQLFPVHRCFLGAALFLACFSSCAKPEDEKGPDDPRLNRPFCNNPAAVNYNWDFPGKPDSTVCFFPSDVFAGTYIFHDSIYAGNDQLDTVQQPVYTLQIFPLSRTKLGIVGFCGANDTLKFTADRYYQATADSIFTSGQPFCRFLDTLTGTLIRSKKDSSLQLSLSVISDTGANTHRGTAYKQ